MAAPGTIEYGSFGPRLIAYILDYLIVFGICVLPLAGFVFTMYVPLFKGEQPGVVASLIGMVCILLCAILGIGYWIYFIGAKGATPGKKMLKLRVTFPDGRYPIGYGKAFLRLIGYAVSGMICYIGFLMILWDKQKRGLHDKIAGTIVIRES